MVFDSNIYISALILPGGQAEKAFSRIFDGVDDLLISKAILDEVLSTLAGKFGHDPDTLSHLAVTLTDMSELVRPEHRVKVFADDPDNRILECAEAGEADCIVTGDKAMQGLKEYRGIRLISLRAYLAT